jgi:hypothetical protein
MDPALRDQIIGALRIIVPTLLGIAVTAGWLTEGAASEDAKQILAVAAALVTIGSVLWSIHWHRQTSQIARVADMPQVKEIVVSDKKLADASPANVISDADKQDIVGAVTD